MHFHNHLCFTKTYLQAGYMRSFMQKHLPHLFLWLMYLHFFYFQFPHIYSSRTSLNCELRPQRKQPGSWMQP